MRFGLLLVSLSTGLAVGQPGSGVQYWPAAKLKGYSTALKAKTTKGMGSEQLANLGNYTFMVARREESGEPEVHMNWSDVHIPQDGEATIVWGGKVEGGHETQPGEIRGGKIVGGTSQKVRVGDVVVIPAGMPHQTVVEKGKPVTVMIMKVEKK